MNINQSTDALIIIDMQRDFVLPGAPLYVKDGEKIVNAIVALCSKFNNIFFTQDNHPFGHKSFASSHKDKKPFDVVEMYGWRRKPYSQVLWPDHCVQGTPGVEIVEELRPELNRAKAIIRKGMNPEVDSYSAFIENVGPDMLRASTGFIGMLQELGIKRLFFVGLARDYCVRFSAEDAAANGFESFIIDNLTKSVDVSLEGIEKTTQALLSAGIKLINYSDIGP